MTTPTTEAFEALMPEPHWAPGYNGPLPDGAFTADQMQAIFNAATERAAKQEREKCADVAMRWSNSGRLLLSIGEATAQELRSCKAVARGIAAAIRGGAGKGAA